MARQLCAFLLLVLTMLTIPASAQHALPTSSLEVVTADGRSHRFLVEVASTPDQQAQGLMYRQSLPADSGMLFDFGRPRPISMWMKNTFIPLDMIFIAGDGRIARVAERTVPQSLETIASGQPVRAVLELNGGTAARLGLKPGDRVIHPIFAGP